MILYCGGGGGGGLVWSGWYVVKLGLEMREEEEEK